MAALDNATGPEDMQAQYDLWQAQKRKQPKILPLPKEAA
jgi:hypothetical protein